MTVDELIQQLGQFRPTMKIRLWVEDPEMMGVPVVDSYLDDGTALVLYHDPLQDELQIKILDWVN